MNSLILTTATRLLLPLLLLFSFFLLIRGHNEPGGGFVGGLVAAAAITLYSMAYGLRNARRAVRIHTLQLAGLGLLLALASGLLSLAQGLPFMTVLWLDRPLPVIGKVSTAFMFDVGVFMVVVGVALTIIFAMAEEEGI
jgi:multicomponent Na+:H+ antiporter subunit B